MKTRVAVVWRENILYAALGIRFHSADAAVTMRAAGAGAGTAKLGRSRCVVKFKATQRGRGLPIVHRWRCAIRKILRAGLRWGAGERSGNEFSVQHTTRRCTRVSNVATLSTVSFGVIARPK
ncbi:unnamed protein product [Colias eurytheme]|nr:unnamed protein product [Colias eurytheme]